MIRMIFSTVRAPHEPALTVESFAISATGRPSTAAVPVITPSAGRPSARTLANAPSSVKLPSSVSRAIRSRANSLPWAAADLVIPGRAAVLDPRPDLGQLGVAGLAVRGRPAASFSSSLTLASVLCRIEPADALIQLAGQER